MKKSVYTRPPKPMFVSVQHRDSSSGRGMDFGKAKIEEPLIIDKASECHVTPMDVARRMVEYLGQGGDRNTLEPSAGTGALVSALLASGHSRSEICAVERHHKLADHVARLGVPVVQNCFLEYMILANWQVLTSLEETEPPQRQVRCVGVLGLTSYLLKKTWQNRFFPIT
ncbi:methyltransferase type 11 [Roseibium algae]|uniref:Methyltransferase type 11 n=1 Tax=Roseibium algae TaxID=3123038 RepID=A0ABU8TRX1_9HYPH